MALVTGALPFFVLVAVVLGSFFAVAIPGVIFINRTIGKSYDAKARALFASPPIANEPILYAEDDLAMSLRSIAFLAVGVAWGRADVRVTPHTLFVAQHRKFFGKRMGQPILGIPLGPFGLPPALAALTVTMHVAGQPRLEGRTVVLPLDARASKHSLRLEPRDPEALLRAIESALYRGA